MKYVIWGAGLRGRRLLSHLKSDDVIAFVDRNDQKVGGYFCGKEVISLEEYAGLYRDTILIIAHTFEKKAVEELKALGIGSFMCLSDCPGELQGDSTGLYLLKYVKRNVNSTDIYGIWGCTVYGLEVYSWLEDIGNKQSYIIIPEGTDAEIVQLMKKNGYRFILENDVDPKRINCILNCIYSEYESETAVFPGIEQKDIYDCTNDIEEYHNPHIEKFKNINMNKKCVIVATGPSLRMEDLDKLAKKNILTYGVNKIGYAYASTHWRPTYYVGEDMALMESEYFNTIRPEQQSEYAFISDTCETFWSRPHRGNVYKYHFCDIWTVGRYPEFSEELSRKAYQGGTIVYTCIQLAAYMGFKEIYLLGVDFTGANEHGSRYGHFYSECELTSVSYTDQVKLAYEKAKLYADEHGIKIYNATRGGRLEVFERVDFDSVF